MNWFEKVKSNSKVPVEEFERKVTASLERYPHYLEWAGSDREFACYLYATDNWLIKHVGVTHNDLADRSWREDYEAGREPAEVCPEILREEGLWL